MKIPSRLEEEGSKMDTGVGSGLFCEELSISESFKLPDHCSVFQAEINAIHEALKWLRVLFTRARKHFVESKLKKGKSVMDFKRNIVIALYLPENPNQRLFVSSNILK